MPITTAPTVPNREIEQVLGIVARVRRCSAPTCSVTCSQASATSWAGARAGYQKVLRSGPRARDGRHDRGSAREMGADAVIGVDIDYEAIGETGSMLMVSMNGTAVKLR